MVAVLPQPPMPAKSSARTACAAVVAVGAAMASLMLGGCVERLIRDSRCGDGHQSDGELCLGEGERSTLSVDTLAALALRVGDFDGDGRSDLIVLGTLPDGLVSSRLWRGNGDGSFATPIDPGLFGCSAHPVPGSIDGDESTDLLVDECAPSVLVFRGDTSGAFVSSQSVNVGVETRTAGLIDADGDGLREVAVLGTAPQGGVALAIAERLEDGVFAPPVTSLVSPGGFDPSGFSLLDFNGDEHLDALVVHSGAQPSMGIAVGAGGLAFELSQPVSDLVVDGAGARDLDGDGDAEIFAVRYATEEVLVFEVGDGDEELRDPVRTTIPGIEPGPLVLADLDDDGIDDLLLAELDSANLQAWLGRADGRFDDRVIIELDEPVDQIATADFDGDGTLDIVAGSFFDATIRVLLSEP